MSTTALTTTEKAKRFDNLKKRDARAAISQSKTAQQVWVGGAAITATVVVAFVQSKVPRLRYFTKNNKVPVVPVIFIPAAIAGLVFNSPAVFGGAIGPLVKFAGDWVEQQDWAQPKA